MESITSKSSWLEFKNRSAMNDGNKKEMATSVLYLDIIGGRWNEGQFGWFKVDKRVEQYVVLVIYILTKYASVSQRLRL